METCDVCWDRHTRIGMWTLTISCLDVLGEVASCLFLFISCFVRGDRFTSDSPAANCKTHCADIPVVATVGGEEGGMSEQSSFFLR